MFVDASAIVAILKGEPEAGGFLAALDAAKGKVYCSPIARYEATVSMAMAMVRQRGDAHLTPNDLSEAESLVEDLLKEAGAREIHISESLGRDARAAAARYGKLAGHPARLNMGDCFAYACAKGYRLPLLYKGDDFKETDIG